MQMGKMEGHARCMVEIAARASFALSMRCSRCCGWFGKSFYSAKPHANANAAFYAATTHTAAASLYSVLWWRYAVLARRSTFDFGLQNSARRRTARNSKFAKFSEFSRHAAQSFATLSKRARTG